MASAACAIFAFCTQSTTPIHRRVAAHDSATKPKAKSSRKVLQEICARQGVPDAQFGAVCVVVDKIEKLPRAEVERELGALGLPAEAIALIKVARSRGGGVQHERCRPKTMHSFVHT